MTPLALILLYAIGGAMIAGGIFIISHRSFPAWVSGRLLWPLVVVTPRIATLQGWAALSFGGAVLTLTFAPFAPVEAMAGMRILFGASAAAGVVLFAYSTWISRRPPTGPPATPR